MEILEFLWPEDRIAHIGRHKVTPEEFEEACFGEALVLRAKSHGKNPVYYVLGETGAGRHLFCVVIAFPGGKGYPVNCARDDLQREAALCELEEAMKIPDTDSISELAEFWDTHDVTDFADELEEVREPVFSGRPTTAVRVPLSADELRAVRKIAASRGVEEATVIREWVQEKLHH